MNLFSIVRYGWGARREKNDLPLFGETKTGNIDISYVSRYFTNQSVYNETVSDKVWNDLNGDDLFAFIDRTNSRVGQQLLFSTLHTLSPHSLVQSHEEVVSSFKQDENWRKSIQQELSRLNHRDAYEVAELFQHAHVLPSKSLQIAYRICLFLPTLLLGLLLITHSSATFWLFVLSILVNVALHYWHKKNLWSYLHSIPQFLTLMRVAAKLSKDNRLKAIDSTIEQQIATLQPLRKRLGLFRFDVKMESDVAMIAYIISELIRSFFLLEPNALLKAIHLFNTQQKEVESVYKFVGSVDLLYSVASLQEGVPYYCAPVTATPKSIEANEMYHPLIENCVLNNFSNKQKSIILTGSNMSGKTAFIRTIAINALTAQTIHTCFAKKFKISPMQLFSSIQISDDLLNAKSYYLQEVLTVKEMIDATENEVNSLFLLDELFKGTNTTERIAAGKAILTALNCKNNIVIIATHDLELAEMLQEKFDLYHFSEQVAGTELTFDYKLKSGMMTHRNAIRILELYNYPPETVAEAYATALLFGNKQQATF